MTARMGWIAAAFVVTGCATAPMSQHVASAEGESRYELFALDARTPHADDAIGFHGYDVVGRTSVDDAATRLRLANVIRTAAPAGEPCCRYCPEHGLRVIAGGQATDYVLCFTAGEAEAFGNGGTRWLAVDPDARPMFDAALRHGGAVASTGDPRSVRSRG